MDRASPTRQLLQRREQIFESVVADARAARHSGLDDPVTHLARGRFGEDGGDGLSTCYGIVRKSGGAIAVDSALGKGTTFRMLLPRSEGPS